jgi:hypothetical protein
LRAWDGTGMTNAHSRSELESIKNRYAPDILMGDMSMHSRTIHLLATFALSLLPADDEVCIVVKREDAESLLGWRGSRDFKMASIDMNRSLARALEERNSDE